MESRRSEQLASRTHPPSSTEDAPEEHVTSYRDYRSTTHDAQPGHGIRGEAERSVWLAAPGALEGESSSENERR